MEKFLHKVFLNKCYICDFPSSEVICSSCLLKFKVFKNTKQNYLSFFEYNDIAKKTLYLSKYPPYYFYLLKFLSEYALKSQNISNFIDNANKTFFCPVPLSSLRLFERGFNQAEVICKSLEYLLKIPYLNIINRRKDTNPLYMLDRAQRKLELEGAFKTNFLSYLPKILNYSNAILVDDLITTSTTLGLCRKELQNLGFVNIKYLSLFIKN